MIEIDSNYFATVHGKNHVLNKTVKKKVKSEGENLDGSEKETYKVSNVVVGYYGSIPALGKAYINACLSDLGRGESVHTMRKLVLTQDRIIDVFKSKIKDLKELSK